MLPQMYPPLPEVGGYRRRRARDRSAQRVQPRGRVHRRAGSRLSKHGGDGCVLPMLQILREEKRSISYDPLRRSRATQLVPEPQCRTLGLLSQLRWDASKGKRSLQVEEAPAGHPKPEDVMAETAEAVRRTIQRDCNSGESRRASHHSRASSITGSRGVRTAASTAEGSKRKARGVEKLAELRQFRASLVEDLEQCSSSGAVDAAQMAIATAICCSTPGVAGSFVQLAAPCRRQFLQLLDNEVQKRRSVLASMPTSAAEDEERPETTTVCGSRSGKRHSLSASSRTRSATDELRAPGDDCSDAFPAAQLPLTAEPNPASTSRCGSAASGSRIASSAGYTSQGCTSEKLPSAADQRRSAAASMSHTLSAKFRRRRIQKEVDRSDEANTAEAECDEAQTPLMCSEGRTVARQSQRTPASTATGDCSTGNYQRKVTKSKGGRKSVRMIKVCEMEWAALFQKAKVDNTVHRDDLVHLLEQLGYVKPHEDWIEEIFSKITQHTTLTEDEWVRFVRVYGKRLDEAYNARFVECDVDGNGVLCLREIADLVRSFQVEPMNHVLKDLVDEVGVGKDGEVVVDLEAFKALMDLLKTRDGFSRTEYNNFMQAYQRYDTDASGEIDLREFTGILTWLGFNCEPQFVKRLLKEVDSDGSGVLNKKEFIKCMRLVRENKIAALKDCIKDVDEDGDGAVGDNELRNIFAALGYIPDLEAIEDACKDAGITASDRQKGLDLSEMWRLVEVFRSREGFTSEEAADIDYIFNKTDKDGLGEITRAGVGKAIRWLGALIPYEHQQKLITLVDLDDSGLLSLPEFRKLVRMVYEKELEDIAAVFDEFASEGLQDPRVSDPEEDMISLRQARAALEVIHCVNEDREPLLGMDDLFPYSRRIHDCVDKRSFLVAAKRCKKIARKLFRERGGFDLHDIMALRDRFVEFDKDNSGDISRKELVLLIEHTFPEMAHSREQRPRLQRLLEEADVDGSSTIDFQEYLLLMGHLREIQDHNRLAKEQRATKLCGYNKGEVSDFRGLFLHSDTDNDGALTIEEVMRMLHEVCPLGAKNEAELRGIFHSVLTVLRSEFPWEGAPENAADFPEFLLLMHKLLEVDFAQINSRAKALGIGGEGRSGLSPK